MIICIFRTAISETKLATCSLINSELGWPVYVHETICINCQKCGEPNLNNEKIKTTVKDLVRSRIQKGDQYKTYPDKTLERPIELFKKYATNREMANEIDRLNDLQILTPERCVELSEKAGLSDEDFAPRQIPE